MEFNGQRGVLDHAPTPERSARPLMNRIEWVVVDECVGQESTRGQLCERLGERPIKFVFLVTEHPGIPDTVGLRSALLTRDRVLHNLWPRASRSD
jgi:hypothetical protein